MVMVPLFVQLATVAAPDTVIVTPEQGLGGGVGEGLLFEQEIKLAEPNKIIITKHSSDIFFDIEVVLDGIEINRQMVASMKFID